MTTYSRYINFGCLLFFCITFSLGLQNQAAAVLIAAHRGDSSAAPENTLASIFSAEGSADLTELDIRETSDGELVLMHDATLNRTTDGRGGIRRRTLADLQALDAGSWFSDDFAAEPIPTLEQAITTALSLGIEPLVERKAGSAEIYHEEFLGLGLDESEFRVISFNQNFISDLDTLNPEYQLGVLGSGAITQARLNRLAAKGADFISWRHTSIRNSAQVDLVHANGMELHVWTVNDESRMEQLIELGVDGITTDYPHLLNSLLPQSALAAVVPEPPGQAIALVFAVVFVVCRRLRGLPKGVWFRTKLRRVIRPQELLHPVVGLPVVWKVPYERCSPASH